MAEPISALFSSLAAAGSSALPAATAPSILGGGMTGAGMMTAGAPIVPGLLASSTPTLMGGLGTLGGAAFNAAKDNPLQTLGLGMSAYDRMNQSQSPLQPSAMQSAQQLIGQQQAVPIPQFNSLLQSQRKPIYIG